MASPTELYLPPNLPYPVKVVEHAVQPSTTIERGTRLLTYSFTHISADARPEIRFGTWDSTIDGTVDRWNFKLGETVSQRKAADVPAIAVTEPCKHGVQLGGLCCLCGKDMTSFDYTGFSDASRASIQMTHLANGPTVSFEEAQRIERETAEHLLKSRKLSLIVDLDQTIVHATVDPTVGEWIAEGEAWEARQAQKATSSTSEAESAGAGSQDTVSDSDDEVNPNWEALKDVKKFKLGPEALGQPIPRGGGKDKSVEHDGCMYYIKPRPGWQEFLKSMSSKYEMHVYTMGTRAYAEEVCAAIDPDGKIFGGRLLSRDESGSLTQKSLQRLFPCDQSMVVIIDDRADVWEWSPNLVKVIPYDFFVGIGDINSAFLPKIEPMAPELPPEAATAVHPPSTPDGPPDVSPQPTTPLSISSETAIVVPNAPLTAEDQAEASKSEIFTRNAIALDAQVEERPLAKKQEELEEASTQSTSDTQTATTSNGSAVLVNGDVSAPSTAPKREKAVRKALLKNDDFELRRVQKLLDDVHRQFFEAYDARHPEERSRKRKVGKRAIPPPVPYDVRNIIPRLRLNTLDGVHILFSSVIPLDTNPESTEIWRTAHAFGAQCHTELNSRITHVVAAKRGTVKVDMARRQGGIKIVWLSWFTDSIAYWQRQDETPYLLDPDPSLNVGPASPPSDPHQISSDPEPDADDWDDESHRRTATGVSLELNEVDWAEINDEVEAAMNESDDEDTRSEKSGMKSARMSEEEDSWTDETNSVASVTSTPRRNRKRLRSITPSSGEGPDPDVLRSPLAKRKKLAADRSGTSKLKEAFSAADLAVNASARPGKVSAPGSADSESSDEGYEEESEVAEEDDDFLARELGEDWG